MKNTGKILLLLPLLFLYQSGMANTTGPRDKAIKAAHAEAQEEQQFNHNSDDRIKSEGMDGINQIPSPSDSVEDGSVSKYNFIFYYFYKFKYDQEEKI